MAAELFTSAIITQTVYLHVSDFGYGEERDLIVQKLNSANSGICIHEGYVRPQSIRLISYSVGECKGAFIQYTTQFECDICTLYEGMKISECIATNVYASAGITGDVYLPLELTNGEKVSYIKVYLLRDTHLDILEALEEVNEQNKLTVEVIGTRFQVQSRFIEAICRFKSREGD